MAPIFRILLTGDWHCGDKAGLTPPSQWKACGKHRVLAEKLWKWFESTITEYGPYDMAIFTADMVEGVNSKNTIELYTADTEEQAEIAAECAEIIPCKKENMRCVKGTPFHTAGTCDFENHFCDTLGIDRPKSTLRINIKDLVRLNVRHTAGRSSIPYGQGTPTLKELINEMISAVRQGDTPADIVIRGHTHLSLSVRLESHESISVPCLKYPDSVFGRKLQEGQYDMGIGILDIYGEKDWVYRPILIPLQVATPREWENWGNE